MSSPSTFREAEQDMMSITACKMIVSTDEDFAINVDGNLFAVSKHLLVMLRDLREVVVPTSKADLSTIT